MNTIEDVRKGPSGGVPNRQAEAARERHRLPAESDGTRGPVPLLPAQHDQPHRKPSGKQLLRRQVRRLSKLSPYLVLLVVPGGLLALPAIAWWLGRRRKPKQ